MTEVHREKQNDGKVWGNPVTSRPENLPECRKDELGINQASSKPKARLLTCKPGENTHNPH